MARLCASIATCSAAAKRPALAALRLAIAEQKRPVPHGFRPFLLPYMFTGYWPALIAPDMGGGNPTLAALHVQHAKSLAAFTQTANNPRLNTVGNAGV